MRSRASAEKLIGPLTIDALANGGKGIARDNGRVIFVSGAFPGDIVRCRLHKEKKNYAEGEVAELLQPSPLRRIPPCPAADECGGCQWQQLPYAEQLSWKQQLFADTLVRQVGIASAQILPIQPADEEFGYRSRVQVKCFSAPSGFITGFFRPQSRFVVAVEECPLMPPELNLLLAKFRNFLAASSYADKVPQIDLSIGSDSSTRAVVHYLGEKKEELAALLVPVAKSAGCALAIQAGRKDSLQLVHGDGELQISVDHREIQLNYAAGGFAQINLKQNQKLVQAVVAAADLSGQECVLDLYCGMGNFSLPLARRAASVVGVEDFSPSIEMARRNALNNRIGNTAFHAMPAEQVFSSFKDDFDLLVLDPPRAGAFSLVKQLQQHPIKKIIYVSCDPQTLARDLKVLLHNGYRLISTQAFDMFPQTYHVESLSVLEYSAV